jgi:hypothetical protein
MPKESKLTKRARATRVLDGLAKRFAPDEILVVSGESYSAAELIALVRRQIAALDAVDRAGSALRQAVRDETAISKTVNVVIQRLKGSILGVHGPRPDVLGDFGWEVPKEPGPKTARAKAMQVEKAARRREAKKKALAALARRGSGQGK